jgi:hypothetical protein
MGLVTKHRGADNHLPTRQMQVEFRLGEPAWRGIFSPLTDFFYILGQLFPDLASNNSELLTSLASVLK